MTRHRPSNGPAPADDLERVRAVFEEIPSTVVAYSGGVDSAVVAAVAQRVLGERAVAITAAAETMAGHELDDARSLARTIGIRHTVITYSELADPEFRRNPTHRCYVCQGIRMDAMRRYAEDHGLTAVCDGTNASDPGPDRPGLKAIRERGVRSPLLEAGLEKAQVRSLARHLGLEVWDRPSNACLSSRIPHGQVVTLGKLRRIERAEDLLRLESFQVLRVRHDGTAARVEVGVDEIERLQDLWPRVEPKLLELGFSAARIDPRGYGSGGANRRAALPLATGRAAS